MRLLKFIKRKLPDQTLIGGAKLTLYVSSETGFIVFTQDQDIQDSKIFSFSPHTVRGEREGENVC